MLETVKQLKNLSNPEILTRLENAKIDWQARVYQNTFMRHRHEQFRTNQVNSLDVLINLFTTNKDFTPLQRARALKMLINFSKRKGEGYDNSNRDSESLYHEDQQEFE